MGVNIIANLKHRWVCHKLGHNYYFIRHGLTGDWIRCNRCGRTDEYIPGVHEPKGYLN